MAKSWEEIRKEREEKLRSFSNPIQNNANKMRSQGFLVANPKPQQRTWEEIRKERGYIEPEPEPEKQSRLSSFAKTAGYSAASQALNTADALTYIKLYQMAENADALANRNARLQSNNRTLNRRQQMYPKAAKMVEQEKLVNQRQITRDMINKRIESEAKLKEGLGTVGTTVADIGLAGTDMLSKAALSALTGLPLPVVFGIAGGAESFQDAINEGRDMDMALKYGIGSGVITGGVESLFGVGASKLSKAATGKIGANILSKMPKGVSDYLSKLSDSALGKIVQSAAGEGLEEGVEYDLQRIYRNLLLNEQTPRDVKEQAYSMLVGAGVGGLFGGVATGVNTALYKSYAKQLDAMYKNTINNLPEDSPILERVRQLQDDNVNIDDNTKLWVINSAREGGMEFESETDKLLQNGRQKETFFSNDNKVQDQLVEQGQNIVKTQNIASQAVNPVLSTFNIQNIENAREVKQSIYEFYKNSIISDSNTSKPILNKSSGMNVEVSRATINQTFQADEKYAKNQDNEIKIAAMGNLVDLIQNGEFTVVDDTDTPSSKVKYAEIKGTVNFNNVPYEITMDIRRTDNGRKLFVHSLSTNYQQVSGKKSGVIYDGVDERVRQQYPKVYDILDRIGKATNTKFKFVDTIYDPTGQIPGFANGQYDPTTDSIEIALDTFNPFMVVAKHEITHMLEKENPKLYREYKDYVLSAMKENGTYDVQYERMAELYKSRGLEVDKNAIEDELVADATELFLTDENAINSLVAENKTLGQKILDVLRKLIEKIEDILEVSGFTEGWLNTEQLREAERLWVNALSDVAERQIFPKEKQTADFKIKNSLKDKIAKNINHVADITRIISVNYELDLKEGDMYDNRGKAESWADRNLNTEKFIPANKGIEYLFTADNVPVHKVDYDNRKETEALGATGSESEGEVLVPSNAKFRITYVSSDYDFEEMGYYVVELEFLGFDDDVKYSLKDSEGRNLTKEQQEYFKDSKVRDDKGNLLVMYHGTNRDFNVFWTDMMPQFFTQYKDYADSYATKSNRKGKIKTVYLNITKPFDTRDKKAFDIFNNEYVEYRRMKNRPINKIDSPRMINFVEADGLYPFLRKMQREGKLDYDGIVVDEIFDAYTPSYVPLQSEQIKEVTNKAPTKDKDIRYSLKNEELDDLGFTYPESTLDGNSIKSVLLEKHSEYKTNKEALNLATEAIKDLQKVKFSISSTGRKVDWDRAGIRTIADGISREFINKGYVELKGRKVNSLEELAVIGQIFRDPRFETLRIIYTKNNKIVAHEGISSRIPGLTSAFLNTPKRSEYSSEYEYQTARNDFIKTRYDDMKDRMKRLKADGYYLLHNHPSGNPKASKEDAYATKDFMDNVEGFKGHVIINSNKYGWLEMGEYSYSIHVEDMVQQQIELFLKPTIEHPLLNESINGIDKAASIAKSLQLSKDKTTIVYTDVKGAIRGIEEIPNGMFNDGISIRGFLRNRGRHFGSGRAFLNTTSQDIFGKSANLVKEKYLTDSILLVGKDAYSHRADTGIEQDVDYEWTGIRSDELESARVNEENEVFYTPNNVEVIKNPTDEQIRQLRAEFRKQYPELAKQGEPPTRRTYDIDGNVYYWKSTDGLHYSIEYYIDKKYNTKTHQSKYFDIKYSDTKFSLKAPMEETKDLIAIHNIGEEQLKGILELGGFPVPSIAITKAEQEYKGFGDISVIFNKDTINPSDRRNKVFASDVYSPTFPRVSFKFNDSAVERLRNKLNKAVEGTRLRGVFPLNIDEQNMNDKLSRNNNDFVEAYKNEPSMKLAYLKDRGINFKPVLKRKTYGRLEPELITKIIGKMGNKIPVKYEGVEQTMKIEPELRQVMNEYYGEFVKDTIPDYKMYPNSMTFMQVDNVVRAINSYKNDTDRMIVDRKPTEDKLNRTVKKKDFESWLKEVSKDIIAEKGIRNKKNIFSPSGNRRSWKQTHDAYTLDNVLKLLKGDIRDEEGFNYGLGSLRANVSKQFKSIQDIKDNKDLLVSEEEFAKIKEEYSNEYIDLISRAMVYHPVKYGDAYDISMSTLAKKGVLTPSALKREFKEDGFDKGIFEDEKLIKDSLDFLQKLKSMPTSYFEAKPQRAVGFDEVVAIVAPKRTDKELLQQLKEKNIKVIKYDEKIEGDRLKKVNSVKGVKFSLKDSQGRTLTQEQAEYFKDSKVRDSNGNLLVMYHGTPKGGFTKFKSGTYFTQNKEYADNYQSPNASSISVKQGELTPSTYEVYLNITKPFDTRKAKERKIFNEEYYNKYGMGTPLMESGLPDWLDGIDLQEFIEEKGYDYDGLILDEGGTGGYGEEVKSRGISYVVFDSNQVKNVDNSKPTNDADIRYSLKDEDGVNYLKSAIKNFDFIVKTSDKSKLLERTKNGSIIHINKVDDDGTVIYSTSWGPARTKVSEFIEKINNGEIVEVGLKRGLTKDEILEKIRVEREKALKTFNPKSVEPKKVSISESATYRGQDMEWTETYIGKTVLKAGEKAYHTSYHDISSFYPKETCFYESYKLNVIGGDKNIYCLIPKKDIIVSEYSGDGEIRVDLERYKNDVDIYYIGYGESFSVKDDFDRVVGKFTLQHLAPEESYSTNNRIKYQLRDNKSAKDVEKLQNTVARLKEQFKLTKGVKLDEKAVRRLAKAILKDYSSKYSSSELEAKLYNVYMGMVNGTMEYDEAQSIITEAAREIIENASILNDAMYKQYSELRNTMRNTAISIDDRYKGDFDAVGGWNDFRKRNFGRMNITSDGMSIDKLYQELSDSYPELFLEDVANPADQLMLISDVLDNLVPIYENPYNRDLNEAVEYLALEIFDGMTSVPEAKPTFADRKKAEKQKAVEKEKDKSKARVEALKNKNAEDVAWLKYQNKEKLKGILEKEKAKRDEAVAKVRKQYQDNAYKTWWRNKLNENDIKSHYQEMIKELRSRRDEKLEQQKTKYKERISGIYEDRKIRQAKDRIRTMAKKLDKMLRSPTQKQHIPKALDKTIAELLTMLDFTTDRQKETTQIKLRDLRAEYEKIAKVSDEEGLSATADPYIVEALEMLHNKRIVDMNLQEIELLRDIVGYFENMVRTYNKAFLGDKWIDVSTKAEGIIKDLETDTPMTESAYGGILYFKDMMNWGMLTPQMFFERMGNTFNSLYDDFRAALDVKINNTKIAQDYMSNLLADSKDKVKEWTGKKAEIKTIKLDSGKTIELTQAQLMSFYLLMKREQARGHIFGLGIKAAPIVAVNNKGIKYVKKQFEPVKITLDDATRMIAMLSKEQKRIADGIGKFMNTYSKQWVNEATLQNYGYELAKEENYFPIKVDRDFLKSDFDNTNLDPTFTSMGFLKATIKGAGNAIILEDVFDVFTEHADKAATYNAFVGVTESTKKIVNYKTQDNSIKQAMNKKFGIQAFNYLKKFMVDLQGGIRTESGSPIVTGLIRRAKRAVLGLNLRTIIQQPTAIVRASALIDIDYLIKGIAMKSDKAEMLEKSPIARWKSWGYFNLDTGRSMKDIILDTVPILDKQYQGMQIADDITWTKIWNAVKLEIEDNEPGLKVGSAEYFDAVNYRFNEIIDRTQVVDTVMHRSDAMRQSDSSWKILTAFMSEPTKSYNLLLNAVEKYNANKSAENKKVLLRTFSAWTATMLVNTLVISMLDMWRRKEDDKETFKDKWIDNILNDVTGYVPIVRDIYSLFEGYSVKRMEYNGIERIVRAINRSKKYIEEIAEDKKHSYPLRLITKDWIESVAYVFGVGAINVSKDLEALLRNYTRWIDDEGAINEMYEFMFKK